MDLFIGEDYGKTLFFRNTAATPVAPVNAISTNGSYGIGDVLNLTISFSENVVVDTTSGIPTLQLETGSSDRYASYTSGSGSNTLTFQYTVQAGDTSADLDQFSSTALGLNGGSINDAAGNPAFLTLAAQSATGSLAANADLVIDTVAPTVTGVDTSTADGTYTIGEVLNLTVGFSEDVVVDTTGGTPRLQLETGSSDRYAAYTSGSGSNTLTFQYTVQTSDTSADLDQQLSSTALKFNGGSITDAAANTAIITLAAPGDAGSLGANADLVIDGVEPTVKGIDSTTGDGTYAIDDVITLTVGFSEVVVVSGTPTLKLGKTGSSDRYAAYTSGSGTSTLTFQYTVQASDTSADLDQFSSTALKLNGGSITDAASNSAIITLADPGETGSLAANADLVIDAVAPTVTGVDSTTADGTYAIGEVLSLTVGFSEVVVVSGTPTLKLETGSSDRYASYSSGSGSSTLTFQYTVQAGDTSADLDQLSSTSLALNGGSITDAAGNSAIITLADPGETGSLAANADLVIDAVAPIVTGVDSTTADGTYAIGEVIDITIGFSEAVVVSGTPTLQLNSGSSDRYASYSSGSGSSTLTFQYTVQAGDTSADLDQLSSSSLTLNGGSINDAAGNAAILTLADPGETGSLAANADLIIDTTKPTGGLGSFATAPAYTREGGK